MVVYTAARTHGMAEADATKVAQFVDVATTEGQRPGYGNGQLPPGYLPITRSGATAPLFRQAQTVAEEVGAQNGRVAGPGEGDTGATDGSGAGTGGTGGTGGSATIGGTETPGSVTDLAPADAAPVPDAGPGTRTSPKPTTGTTPDPGPVAMPDTQPVSSAMASRLIPTLLGIWLLGTLAAILLRVGLSRRRPS
jgi:hypothetical protein